MVYHEYSPLQVEQLYLHPGEVFTIAYRMGNDSIGLYVILVKYGIAVNAYKQR